MMMALGMFVFSLPTLAYQQLQRQHAWRHASTDRVGARPARQFLGPGEESVSLSGWIAPEFAGTPADIDTLRRMADSGRPWLLVDGQGRVWGAYIIESVSETRAVFLQDGTPRRLDFEISLKRTDERALAEAAP